MNWYVLCTKPKREKKLAGQLEKMGFSVFCPMLTEIRQWSDRKKKVEVPLFRSYVFVQLWERDRTRVFEVPGPIHFLFWLGKPATIKDKEIEVIKNWLEDDRYEGIKAQNIELGDKITINSGLLKGKTGTVKQVGKKEIRLVLESLGYVVTTHIKEVI